METNKLKMYFAGSISGGRDDVFLYAKIIESLKQYGEVLTEHIGDISLLTSETERGKTVEDIYRDDTSWLSESSVIVAEVTQPSLGVGYEIGLAESLGKRVICLFRKNSAKNLSAMISGNPKVEVFEYEKVEELEELFGKLFN